MMISPKPTSGPESPRFAYHSRRSNRHLSSANTSRLISANLAAAALDCFPIDDGAFLFASGAAIRV
jgi:hypothetical protein